MEIKQTKEIDERTTLDIYKNKCECGVQIFFFTFFYYFCKFFFHPSSSALFCLMNTFCLDTNIL